MNDMLKLRRVHTKVCSLIIGIVLICNIAVFYTRFSLQDGFSRSSVKSLPQNKLEDNEIWKRNTSSNYTINLEYWKRQEERVERYYHFNISTIQKVHPDGGSRTLTLINGQYPGPLIEASSGDTIVVNVENQMSDEPVTIHWHGLLMREQSFNDGSPWINQCPIPPGRTYTYKIKIEDDQYGTYWYHSYYGTQSSDGISGPLVIHSKDELEDLGILYDKEAVIMVNDHGNNQILTYMGSASVSNGGLIGDHKRFNHIQSSPHIVPHGISEGNSFTRHIPHTILNLDPNSIYRVRVINAGFFLPFELELDSHILKIIEADGTLVEPIEVKSLQVSVAQRYSFILLPQDPFFRKKNYWMHTHSNDLWMKDTNPKFGVGMKNIVSYTNNSQFVETSGYKYDTGALYQEFNPAHLKTLKGEVPSTQNNDSKFPDLRLDIDITGAYPLSRGYLNDKTYLPLRNGSTLYQLAVSSSDNIVGKRYDEQLLTSNENQYMINLNKRGQVVDIILNNYDGSAHPFHLHGHKFWVLAVGDNGYFQDHYYDSNTTQVLNFNNAIFRDTVNVPRFGWAALRFVVDNPGVWPFHCHIGWHMETGLLLQINELQKEYSNRNRYPNDWLSHCRYWQEIL